MKRLEAMGAIAIQADTTYSIVTIVNWGLYQRKGGEGRHPSNIQPTPKQRATDAQATAIRQATDTNKKGEKGKKGEKAKNGEKAKVDDDADGSSWKEARALARELENSGTFNLCGGANTRRRNRSDGRCCGLARWHLMAASKWPGYKRRQPVPAIPSRRRTPTATSSRWSGRLAATTALTSTRPRQTLTCPGVSRQQTLDQAPIGRATLPVAKGRQDSPLRPEGKARSGRRNGPRSTPRRFRAGLAGGRRGKSDRQNVAKNRGKKNSTY